MTTVTRMTETERRKVRAFEKTLTNLPDDMWVFAASGDVYILRKKDGVPVYNPSGSVDPSYIVCKIVGHIEGGDW